MTAPDPQSGGKDVVGLTSVEAGTLLVPDSQIPVGLNRLDPSVVLDNLVLSLVDGQGKALVRHEFGQRAASASVLKLPLSQVPWKGPAEDQPLTLRLQAFSPGGRLLKTRDIPVWLAGRVYSGLSVISHPQEIYPGSTALLEAGFDGPPPPSAWVVWSQGGKVLQAGPWADGHNLLAWQSPRTEGSFSVNLEVFPKRPPADLSARAPFRLTTRQMVTSLDSGEPGDLGPSDSYLSLFHFRGNVRDTGVQEEGPAATRILGSPGPRLVNGFFGYEFGAGEGVVRERFGLPVTADRRLAPFSLTLRSWPLKNLEAEAPLVQFRHHGTGFILGLSATAGGGAVLQVRSGQAGVRSEVPRVFVPRQAGTLTLSVLPEADGLTVTWYKGGEPVQSQHLALSLPEGLDEDGDFQLAGGPDPLPLLWDELGVYYRDTDHRPGTDPRVLARALQDRHGSELEWADGFDGLNLESGWEAAGRVSLEDGSLVLAPGASAATPILFPGAPAWLVKIPAPEGRRGRIGLYYDGDPTPLLSLDLAGGSYTYAGGRHGFDVPAGPLELKLGFSPRLVSCRLGSLDLALTPARSNAGLRWIFSLEPGSKENFIISQLVILKEFAK